MDVAVTAWGIAFLLLIVFLATWLPRVPVTP